MTAYRRTFLAVAAAAAGLAVLSAWAQPQEKKEKASAKPISVPLKDIYSTSPQENLKELDRSRKSPYRAILDDVCRRADRSLGSNVFLVLGDDIEGAIYATEWAFQIGWADGPVPQGPESKSTRLWLVAYFGSYGTHAPAVVVKSVEVEGKRIRVTYTVPGSESPDEFPYLAWVPLGKLEKGAYALELFDAKEQRTTLIRRVEVPGK